MNWFDPNIEDEIKVKPNGVRVIPTGMILGRPLHKGEIREALADKSITKETTHIMHQHRREQAAEAALAGQRRSAEKHYKKVRKGQAPPTMVTDIIAWELANEKLADAFYESKSAKSMSDVFSTMGRASGFLGDKNDKPDANSAESNLDLEKAKVVYNIFVTVDKGERPLLEDVIDLEARDADNPSTD
jgi:hypothetical protein